ncbi:MULTISPECIES: RNA recognition motif domain-containing protein [unclassified Tolypothrix]|uniref:RNA recognition motif domain-containing protein n=1 Tax=unclassified Tolypothrix TaxID=2649714 RepID=UPI0005EAB3AB|nr:MULTISPECIES: RNA-binding protein [unclassified Tolypothrix]BAY91213.1 RNA-binding protein [Microchaete diplosiphon NIES-3275]EKF00006.1 putative RNA-binding protein [Tolypothrix sp. PCC 7601]MBE9080858.1 RNA-binding protein [Tolypothrix sp. LEGE 11397]UYD25295.1 RNA-binding protein [Tolypothrix sp. PCC 7712]UYD32465.1 RNA-binding protein [Tolypothrix sp. PCC 7601]
MLKVSNLPISTTESDIDELFSHYRIIKIHRIDIKNDESIAYVELGNDEEEKDAIEKLNKRNWRGKDIYVGSFRGELVGVDQPENK